MKRFGMLAAAAVLGTGLLAGCGGDDDSSNADGYCDTLADTRAEFAALDSGELSSLEDFRAVADDLADQAPDAVSADWDVLQKAFDDLDTSLDDAGISLAEIEEMSESGELPEGVSEDDLLKLGEELNSFGEGMDEAGESITTHAKDECDIDLNDTSGQ